MKIVFFIESLGAGGKERRLAELMKGLRTKPGISFELVVMNNNIHYKQVFDLGIKIHYLVRSVKKDISVFNKFYKICKAYKPDIVHCWDTMTSMYSIPTCKLLHIKLVNGMIVDAPSPSKQTIFNKHWLRSKIAMPFSDLIIANSKAGLDTYNAPQKRSVFIYNGLDLRRFENLPDPAKIRKEILGNESNNMFIAGMVAAFEDRKDYKTLIKAATTLIPKYDNLSFILVGDGVTLKEMKESVPSSIADKIIFTGRRTDVESISNIFDTGILLTNSKVHGEGISNSIIEYMALGKPVIATRGGGTNEAVIDNETGFLIDAESQDQLTNKIEKLINDKILRETLGKNGRQMVLNQFDLDIMTEKYVSTYQRLLNGNTNE